MSASAQDGLERGHYKRSEHSFTSTYQPAKWHVTISLLRKATAQLPTVAQRVQPTVA